MMMYHPIKFVEISVDTTETVIHEYMSPDSDPEQSPCMTLWPMMMHHHTKFGYRRFGS